MIDLEEIIIPDGEEVIENVKILLDSNADLKDIAFDII